MIDFAKIKYTVDGYACHYFGRRQSYGSTLECFGVFHPQYGVREIAYDSDGKRLKFDTGEWVSSEATDCQIIKPRQKVEVVRWLTYHHNSGGGISVRMHGEDPEGKELTAYAGKTVKVTEVFEVPE